MAEIYPVLVGVQSIDRLLSLRRDLRSVERSGQTDLTCKLEGEMSGGGLSLDEDGEGFVLNVTGADGTVSKVALSEEHLMSLIQSAPAFRERILLRHRPRGEGVSPVLVTLVAEIGLQPDSLGQNILLTLVSATRGQLTFALEPRGAQILLDHLPGVIAEVEAAYPGKRQ